MTVATEREGRWMSVPNAARHYDIGTETIRRWARDGRIDARKIGKQSRGTWLIWAD